MRLSLVNTCKLTTTSFQHPLTRFFLSRYQFITKDEAMLAFKEQRVRYNKKFAVAGTDGSQPWSLENVREEMEDEEGNKPDFIAAEQYRKRWIREHAFSKRIVDAATKAANSGSVRASEIIRVHPAWDGDPRSTAGLNGTASLRKSKSEYNPAYSFSLITRVGGKILKGKPDSLGVIEKKWYVRPICNSWACREIV